MIEKFPIPRGTADILPSDIKLWNRIESQARSILENHHYREIRTPLFEQTDLFARSMGQTSDVVQKQMLNLASQRLDDDGKMTLSGLSLRPEGTATVVRAYIENRFDRKEILSKLYYVGPMFRGERPQKGRLRQFNQIGAEAIGPDSGSPYLDAEIIALSMKILDSFGLTNAKLKINTLGSPEDKEKFADLLRSKFKEVLVSLCPDCQDRFDRNVFRILDCKNKDCKKTVSDVQLDKSFLSEESVAYLKKLKQR